MKATAVITKCRSSVIAFLLIPMLLLGGCAKNEMKPADSAFIFDVQLISEKVYWLGKSDGTYELFRRDTDGEKSIKSFIGATSILVYCEKSACYIFADDGGLSAYYPETESTTKICDLQAKALLCATDDYVLASAESGDYRIKIGDGSKQRVENMPDTGMHVLDIYGNVILVWDANQNAILRYDCDSDSVSPIWSSARDPGIVMVTGLMYNDSFYYAESRGGLHRVSFEDENASDTQVIKGFVIALARTDNGMLVAVNKDSDIAFCLFSDEGEMTELTVWRGAHYIVNGSCLLRVTGNEVICAVMSESKIFEYEIANY